MLEKNKYESLRKNIQINNNRRKEKYVVHIKN